MENFFIQHTSNIVETEVPRDVKLLAENLCLRHGDVRIAKENAGWMLYMASPTALERDGSKELHAKHLAVAAEKYLGIGQWVDKRTDMAACCMKYSMPYSVSKLQEWPPLDMRGIKNIKKDERYGVFTIDSSRCLVQGKCGNLIPDDPGEVIPVTELEEDHAAIQYLRSRNYDPESLYRQFRLSYCWKEAPESKDKGRFYKKTGLGFKDTPQGRLIFYIDISGSQKGWQARYLDVKDDNYHYIYHPYTMQWTPVAQKVNGVWNSLSGDVNVAKDLSKYKTAFGARRNSIVMGFDAAVEYSQLSDNPVPTVVCVEGPLDAARLGVPAISFLGKHVSDNQARLLSSRFKKAILIPDNDEAGSKTRDKILNQLRSHMTEVQLFEIPKIFKDIGETPKQYADILRQILKL